MLVLCLIPNRQKQVLPSCSHVGLCLMTNYNTSFPPKHLPWPLKFHWLGSMDPDGIVFCNMWAYSLLDGWNAGVLGGPDGRSCSLSWSDNSSSLVQYEGLLFYQVMVTCSLPNLIWRMSPGTLPNTWLISSMILDTVPCESFPLLSIW